MDNRKNKRLDRMFAGGMQPYFPKNEAQIYMSKFTLDVANYCINDFSNSGLSMNEKECASRLLAKNNEFINM